MDIVITTGPDGHVTYGPWADRQRDALQSTFAPSIFFNSETRPRLQPGDTRIHTNMAVNVFFADETTMRIPTREPSKDWMYENVKRDDMRKYGWFDVKVGSNSSISYVQSQFPTSRGYDALLVLNLDTLDISTSVNYSGFAKSKSCKVTMTMPTPLDWDAQRDWGLDVTIDGADIYLLQDHVQLISDLATDWSSGTAGDYLHFVPNHYNFRVSFLNYAFHFCLNDYNIVDHPDNRKASAFMDVTGPRVEAFVAVASTQYRPEFSTIPFSINLSDAVVSLSLPSWDTHRSFFDGSGVDTGICEVGKVGQLTATASYTFYSTRHPDHQEKLVLHLEGRRVAFKALGWVLRRMFCIKDNYFGGFTQFTTWTEFSEKFDHDPTSVGDPVEEKWRPGRSDPFSVQVTMNIEESLILMSDEVFSANSGIVIPVPQLQMALKSTEHFLELSLDALPTYVVHSEDLSVTYLINTAPPIRQKEIIFVEGIEVKANRLFGPKPRGSTYLCLWEINVPKVTAYLTPEFAVTLKSVFSAVAYNYHDEENAPAEFFVPKSLPDVTFVRMGLGRISGSFFGEKTALTFDIADGMNLDLSTLATRSFASSLGLVVPSIVLTTFDGDRTIQQWEATGRLETSITLDQYSAPPGWQRHASEQQAFLKAEDAPTKRIWYMYTHSGSRDDGLHVNGLYIPRPQYKDPQPPRAVDDTTAQANSKDQQSSASESDSSNSALPARTLRRRRTRTGHTTGRGAISSAGDESDSVSEVTALSDSEDERPIRPVDADIAQALAARLRLFRCVHDRVVPSFPAWCDEASEEVSHAPPAKVLSEGKVVKLVLRHINLEMGPQTVHTATALANIMAKVHVRPEVQLDQLLLYHTEEVLGKGSQHSPVLYEVQASKSRIRVNTAIVPGRAAKLDILMGGVSSSIHSAPGDGDSEGAFDAIVTNRSMLATLFDRVDKPQTSLADVGLADAQADALRPILQLRFDNAGACVHSDSENQLRVRAGLVELQAVTASAASLMKIANVWKQSMSALPPRAAPEFSYAAVLSTILYQSSINTMGMTSPPFFYEGTYHLHANDARSIRRDPGFLALARMRQWLRQIRISHPELPDNANVSTYIVSELLSREDSFGNDAKLLMAQPFIHKALGPGAVLDPSPPATAKSASVFVGIKSLIFRHHERSVESDSILSSRVHITSASVGLNKSQSRLDQGLLTKIRAVAAVKGIDIELQDSVLPAVETLLHQVEGEENKSSEETSPPSLTQAVSEQPVDKPAESSAASDSSSILILELQLQDMQAAVLAGGVKLRLSARQAVFGTRYREARRSDLEQMPFHSSAFLTCSKTELALLLPVKGQKGSEQAPDRVVCVLALVGARSTADKVFHGVNGQSAKLKAIVGLEGIQIDSRPQLRAFLAFATDWQKEHLACVI